VDAQNGRPVVLRGGTVLPMDDRRSVLDGVDVLVVGERIEAVGRDLPVPDGTLEVDAVGPHLERIAQDWSDGVDHGPQWPSKIVGAKYHAVESAKRVVDIAMDMSGGAGLYKTNELERLYRDVRAGGFHPANSALVHEIVGKTTLGIDLGEQPRWG